MANTTNLGLGKLAGTEKLKTFPSMQSDNMDTLDTAIGAGFGKNSKPSISQSMKNLGGGMAVLCDNNTHAAIPAGHYAYVMNHGTLTEGLYQNLSGSQIAANATLSGSDLTAVSGGGLNSLYSNLNSHFVYKTSGSMNTFTTPGLYYCENCTDVPSPYWDIYSLIVIAVPGTNYCKQLCNSLIDPGMTFERYYGGSGWSDWNDTSACRPVVSDLSTVKYYRKPHDKNYGSFIISGTVGGIGAVLIGVTINNGVISSRRNLMDGTEWQNANFIISYGIDNDIGWIGLKTSSNSTTKVNIIGG